VEALRGGASVGRAFELLQPLAQRRKEGTGFRPGAGSSLVDMFAKQAIDHLVNASEVELVNWFTRESETSPLPLHRAVR
jgi:hypothetical protein